MIVKMTINEANARIEVLKQEIQWIEPLVDPKLAHDLEMGMEEAPPSLEALLTKEMEKRHKELARLKSLVNMYMSDMVLDFDTGE